MAKDSSFDEPVARLVAATDPSAAPQAAPRFDDPLVDAFSVAAAANRDWVREPDPDVERNLPPVDAVAAASGLMVDSVALQGTWWRALTTPLVVDPDTEPVAIVPDASGRALAIPGGTRTAQRVTRRTAPQTPAVEVAALLPPGRSWWRLVWWSLRGQRISLWKLLALAMLTGLMALLVPVTTAALFDYAIPWGNKQKAIAVLIVFAVASVGAAVVLLARNAFVIKTRDASDMRLSAGLVGAVLRLPVRFFRKEPHGETLARVVAVEQARTVVDDSVLMLILSSVFAFTNLLFLGSLSSMIGLLVGMVIAVLVLLSVLVQRRARAALAKVLATRSTMDAASMEYINAAVPIRAAAAESRAFDRWTEYSAKWLSAASVRITRLNAVQPLTVLAPILINLVLVVAVVNMDTPMTAKQFVPAYSAIVQLTVAMTLLSQNLSQLWEIGPVLQQMDPITEAVPERADQGRAPGPLQGGIALTNVVFGYDPDQPPLFDGLSLSVSPGEFVAIVGPSGSGKSTVLRLMLGFEEPWSGVVEFDGSDLADLDVAAVRRQMGTVTQSSLPFGSTLRECICGPRVVDEEHLASVLAQCGLTELAETIGLDTPIGHRGMSLSGGQRQRVMIARALIGQPRIVLLDEATSALDNVTQKIVMEAVVGMQGTRIAIAHRLSTIERADRVLVVDQGRIVEDGPPDVLRRSGGHFARLAQREEF